MNEKNPAESQFLRLRMRIHCASSQVTGPLRIVISHIVQFCLVFFQEFQLIIYKLKPIRTSNIEMIVNRRKKVLETSFCLRELGIIVSIDYLFYGPFFLSSFFFLLFCFASSIESIQQHKVYTHVGQFVFYAGYSFHSGTFKCSISIHSFICSEIDVSFAKKII